MKPLQTIAGKIVAKRFSADTPGRFTCRVAVGTVLPGLCSTCARLCGRILGYAVATWCLWSIPVLLHAEATLTDNHCAAYLWIAFGRQVRQPDGSLTQRYHIRSNRTLWPNGDDCGDLQAFYRLNSRSVQTPRGYCSAPVICNQGDAYLDITSKTNARIDLYMVGTCGRRQWTAHTTHPLFGKASPDTREPSVRTADLPDGVARLRLRPSRHTPYMQTGTPYYFDCTGNDGTMKSAVIIENQKRIAELDILPGNVVAYTPPHDPNLDRAGHYATKEILVLVEATGKDRTHTDTFTLQLHRTVRGHHRLLPGIILFSAAGSVVLALVITRKRRPWYV